MNKTNKHKVDLLKRGCKRACCYNADENSNFTCGYMQVEIHWYDTKRGACIKTYDVYHNGKYECSFDTKKSAIEYMNLRNKHYGSIYEKVG